MRTHKTRAGSWTQPGQTQTADTAITLPIDPFRDGNNDMLLYEGRGGLSRWKPNWLNLPYTKVTTLVVTSGGTAHTWTFLRPKNWTYITQAVTKNDTTVNVYDDPGLYATTYKYPLPPGRTAPGLVADNGVAAADWVAFQLDNGAWHFSTVASVDGLELTLDTGTPNVDGATAAAGRVLFFFGAAGDKDPATNRADPAVLAPATAATYTYFDPDGLVCSSRPGEPLVLVNANATAASTLVALSGYYGTK